MAFGDSTDEDEKYADNMARWFMVNYCLECPVMTQCAEWVKENPQEHGVFGGLLPSERNPVDTDSTTA